MVEKSHLQAARRNLHKHMQEERLDKSTNLLNVEFELLRRVLGLPHVPEILGLIQAKDSLYMYFRPWCDHSLSYWLYGHPNVGIENAIFAKEHGAQWMVCLTRAVYSLHTMKPGVHHGDINPRNIMITAEEEVLLVDFSIAKQCTSQEMQKYVAPEGKNCGKEADIFSLGAVFFQILTLIGGIRMEGLDIYMKDEPFATAQEKGKLQKWAAGLKEKKQDAAFSKRIDVVSEMLRIDPFERPPLRMVHDSLLAIADAEGTRTSLTCCGDSLPDEEKTASLMTPRKDSGGRDDSDL